MNKAKNTLFKTEVLLLRAPQSLCIQRIYFGMVHASSRYSLLFQVKPAQIIWERQKISGRTRRLFWGKAQLLIGQKLANVDNRVGKTLPTDQVSSSMRTLSLQPWLWNLDSRLRSFNGLKPEQRKSTKKDLQEHLIDNPGLHLQGCVERYNVDACPVFKHPFFVMGLTSQLPAQLDWSQWRWRDARSAKLPSIDGQSRRPCSNQSTSASLDWLFQINCNGFGDLNAVRLKWNKQPHLKPEGKARAEHFTGKPSTQAPTAIFSKLQLPRMNCNAWAAAPKVTESAKRPSNAMQRSLILSLRAQGSPESGTLFRKCIGCNHSLFGMLCRPIWEQQW